MNNEVIVLTKCVGVWEDLVQYNTPTHSIPEGVRGGRRLGRVEVATPIHYILFNALQIVQIFDLAQTPHTLR